MFCHNNNDNHDFIDDDDTDDVYPERLLVYTTIRKLSKFYLYLDSDVDSLLNRLFALFTITSSSSNNNFIFIIIIIIIIIIIFYQSCYELCARAGALLASWFLNC